jgi:catechol 2,3-dioxygenase-like lactoylglutathione lyase family enzyme
MSRDDLVSVRYMIDDVDQAIDFYTRHFGFELATTPRRRSPR